MDAIRFEWKPFKIDLESMYKTLKQEIVDFDGIIAYETHFEVIKTTEMTIQDVDAVNNYMSTLNQSGELEKLNRPTLINHCLLACRESMLLKTYDEMSTLEKKIMLRLPLTEADIASILETYS